MNEDRISIPENEVRLRKLPFIKSLPFPLMVEATKLIQRGADQTLLLFWRNVKFREYKGSSATIMANDAVKMKKKYPAFADDIDNWIQQ